MHEERHHCWRRTIECLIFLFWLACGTSYRVVAQAFSVPLITVHRACKSVCNALLKKLSIIVKKVEEIGEGFKKLGKHVAFRRLAGAIDGCHIRIRAPGKSVAQCYYNRKLYASITFRQFVTTMQSF